MMRQLIEVYPLSIFAAISIFIFLGIFLFIVFSVYALESKDSLDKKAQIPLDDRDRGKGVEL